MCLLHSMRRSPKLERRGPAEGCELHVDGPQPLVDARPQRAAEPLEEKHD